MAVLSTDLVNMMNAINMPIVIRKADIKTDALKIVESARGIIQRTAFGALFPEDGPAFISAVGRIVTLDDAEVFVVESHDKIIGGVGTLFSPCIWNQTKLIGDVLFLCASKEAPFGTAARLIEQTMQKIKERGAIPAIRAPVGNKGMMRLFNRIGLKPIETLFMDI